MTPPPPIKAIKTASVDHVNKNRFDENIRTKMNKILKSEDKGMVVTSTVTLGMMCIVGHVGMDTCKYGCIRSGCWQQAATHIYMICSQSG